MSRVQDQKNDGGHPKADPAADDILDMLLNGRQWWYVQRRYELTPRELQIAELVCRGWRNDRIARNLRIRPATVKTHVRNIYRKVKVKSKIAMLLRFVGEANGASGLRG